MSGPAHSDRYVTAALAGEANNISRAPSGSRNKALFLGSTRLASLGCPDWQIIAALRPAADQCGLTKDDGLKSVETTIKSGIRKGQASPRPNPPHWRVPMSDWRHRRQVEASSASAKPGPIIRLSRDRDAETHPVVVFPPRTPPDQDNKPTFFPSGDDGPRTKPGEIRRHIYKRSGVPCRIKIKYSSGGYANWYCVTSSDGTAGWQAQKPDEFVPVPYTGGMIDPFDPELIDEFVFWPEGERDVDSLGRLALPAFTFGGTGDGLPEAAIEWVTGRRIVILADNDTEGEKHAEKKASLCHSTAKDVRIVRFPELNAKQDVSDWIATGKNAVDVSARAEAAPSWSPPPSPEPVGGERALIVRRASDITLEPVQWVWPGRVAVGKLTLIAGDPGLGKSQIAICVAATMTTGGRWPCGEDRCEPGGVIMLSAEDDAADTIVPRLKAAGADTERVHIIPAVFREDGKSRRSFNLAEDLDLLEKKISELDDIRLIIIDPISSYMGKGDANKNTEVRQVLEPIGEMAARLRVAILCVTHLTKGDGKALYRFTGSIAFVAAARAAFIVTADPDDETRRFFLQSKNNLAKPAPGLSFRLEQHLVQDGIIGSAVVWGNEPVERTADEALSSSESAGGITGKDDAADFLRDALSQGPADVLEVEQQARSAGLLGDNQRLRQSKVFRMARQALGVLYRREGFGTGARYVLSLPAASCAPSNPMRAPLQDRAHMHSQGAHDEGEQR